MAPLAGSRATDVFAPLNAGIFNCSLVAMNTVVYNIPIALIDAYRGQQIIVRGEDAAEVVAALGEDDLQTLHFVQLLSLTTDVDRLANWGYGIPVDLVMRRPDTDYARLYRHARLLDKHPVRVSIPLLPGFSKAVKVATSLKFAVHLVVGQPSPDVLREMSEVLDFFLHHSSVTQPVEFFYSLLQAFYHQTATTLWSIQEEDPAQVRYVTDGGAEIISARLMEAQVPGDLGAFVGDFQKALLAERGECGECEFLETCAGYFKWPQKDYSCAGVKVILRTLKSSATELKNDLSAFAESGGAAR